MKFGKHFFVFLLAIGLVAGCYALTIEERVAKTEQDIQMIKNRLGMGGDAAKPILYKMGEIEPVVSASEMLEAIRAGDLIKVTELVEKGKFPVNSRINMAEGKGADYTSTALVEAAKANKLDIVKYLVGKGARVNATDYYRPTTLGAVPVMRSALDYAKQNNNPEMIKFLEERLGVLMYHPA